MATIFFVKDGPRPDNSGPGCEIQLAKLYRHIPNIDTMYLGIEPPTFNAQSPSMYPMRVVVEVSASEVDSNKFERDGFYLLKDVALADIDLSAIS